MIRSNFHFQQRLQRIWFDKFVRNSKNLLTLITQLTVTAITELLARASEIRKKHELIADMTGERFNVFDILGLQASETRTHSAFLRELLDPKGTHGLNDAFLKSFCRMLGSIHGDIEHAKMTDWDVKLPINARVSTEEHIGWKSADCSEGGRIDLVITPDGGARRILIENKIYAGDQECQLVRYRNYDSKALLIYLTLDGGTAGEFSTENRSTSQKLESGVDYFQLSYKEHILNWLDECRKEASNRPLVRETIVQYISLIKQLTQQNTSNRMSEEIANAVLRDKDTLLAYSALHQTFGKLKSKLLEPIVTDLICLANKHGMSSPTTEIVPAEHCVRFWNDRLEHANLMIGFGFEQNKWYFGFGRRNPDIPTPGDEIIREIGERFKIMFGPIQQPTKHWPVCRWWDEYLDWDSDWETLASIYFNKKESAFLNDVADKLQKMKEISDQVLNK